MTPLEALQQGNAGEFVRLVSAVTDVNALDDHGWTLLNWAAGRGDLSAVKTLVDRGADISKTGRDNRTRYLIALAAGHLDTVKYLGGLESDRGTDSLCASSRQKERRLFSKGYAMREVRKYSAWPKDVGAGLDDDALIFIHQDFSVTESVLHGQKVLFADGGSEWAQYCSRDLAFHVPDDIELLLSK
jgi:hypothetical protein